ncbi:putative nicotinate-nucleotide pyrophosphorylase [Selenomonas ruminantium subsp. lactilytica TAM6421]|uniref:Probable nicotinate-nucleotide pyrophosphorylase [carboxylating] n=1 Tax=Selenomonas ruminantium subsp. lactilytica (strain NBRC 103574 / TAM6421) TaxID=927704 RepID=I0GS46_SELRL|nr:carboxylating nicotinate-nucleotide diphosphorylase [Selenomonas ruminantium]BAL83583.1 putative nicotinate-nucleotide pyrophosphorylase [Selenomonas ruminantium subsp. lactilytica TAM6421]
MNILGLDEKIKGWLQEDVGSGDITTLATVPKAAVTHAIIHAKDTGILAGVDVAERVFALLDPDVKFNKVLEDGAELTPTSVIATLDGSAQAILTGERLALNLLQHLSGVATRTHKLAAIAAPYGARLVDTRKTTPGLRLLDKYAVKVGGGANHRLGLYDAILIKDNHIQVAGGITAALERAKAYASHMTKIEIEVEDLTGVEEALAGKADVIMLDNMAPELMTEAVKLIDHRAVVEASGGIDETTLAAAAKSGVDVISVGALTHSVKALDISMDIGEIK